MAPIVPTELSELNSTLHGRARRAERGIEKIDLQRARRYGMAEQQRFGRIKYTYGGVVFIYCPVRNKEVTSFPSRDQTGTSTGTKFTKPILLDKQPMVNEYEHDILASSLARKPAKWTSHSVLVVDMSGSMRRDDVNGARCRSDGVFLALARDYIKAPLDKKQRSATDLISIIIMRDEAEVLLVHEPTTYALYNKIIDLRDWDNLRPNGPGNYIPAIEAAQQLLTSNASAGCALSLLFFSDGSPSDKHIGDFTSSIGDLASKFGRRLSLACIGMADGKEDFSVLNDMVNEAKSYGSQATFGKPSLDSESLSSLVSSLASSVTSTKTEMTEAKSGKSKPVQDVTREKCDTPDHEGKWWYYRQENSFRVNSVSTWDYKKDKFVKLIDPRCAMCYGEVASEEVKRALVCRLCYSYSVCVSCQKSYGGQESFFMAMHRSQRAGKVSECKSNQLKFRSGELIMKRLPSFYIAIKEKIFGEGAERMVRRVRFVDAEGDFIGPRYVAKESRFIENHENSKQRRDYHTNFMRTQTISADFAKQFNEALGNLHTHFGNLRSNTKRYLDNLPRIEFIEPMVVDVKHGSKHKFFLIEKLLDGEYEKFNSNNGYVCREARTDNLLYDDDDDDLIRGMNNLGLGAIEEDEEEEDSDDERSEDGDIVANLFDNTESAPIRGSYKLHELKSYHVPQAFSHFSYVKSKRKLIIVDLQGVLTVSQEGKEKYELTDPVIHRRNRKAGRSWDFGRTDRGKQGINAFLRTHKCSEMCKLLGLEKERLI